MKILKFLPVPLFLSLLLVACEVDYPVEPTEITGEFTIDDVSFELNKGVIGYWGANEDSTMYYYTIFLHTSGIYFDDKYGIVGNGDYASIGIASSKNGIYTSSSYPINDFQAELQPDEALEVEMVPGYRTDGNGLMSSEDFYYCSSGTVLISLEEEVTTITIEAKAKKIDHQTNAVLEENIDVSLQYQGTLGSWLDQ